MNIRYSCQILSNLIFLDKFSKNTQISNFTRIHPVGTEFFRADRQTDRQTDRQKEGQTNITKLIVAFQNIANAPAKKIDVDFAN